MTFFEAWEVRKAIRMGDPDIEAGGRSAVLGRRGLQVALLDGLPPEGPYCQPRSSSRTRCGAVEATSCLETYGTAALRRFSGSVYHHCNVRQKAGSPPSGRTIVSSTARAWCRIGHRSGSNRTRIRS